MNVKQKKTTFLDSLITIEHTNYQTLVLRSIRNLIKPKEQFNNNSDYLIYIIDDHIYISLKPKYENIPNYLIKDELSTKEFIKKTKGYSPINQIYTYEPNTEKINKE